MYIPAALQLNGQKFVLPVTWGLVPAWMKRGAPFEHFKMFNARSETVASKSVFSRLVNSKRCVVVADSFYEWTATAAGKQPWSVQRKDGKPILIAALYDVYRGPLPEKEAARLARLDSAAADEAAAGTAATGSTSSDHDVISVADVESDGEHDDAGSDGVAAGASSFSVGRGGDHSASRKHHTDAASTGSAGRPAEASVHEHATAAFTGSHASSAEAVIDDLEHAYVSVTLLTTSPIPELTWLHDRMPVILEEDDAQRWLDCERFTFDELAHPKAAGARSILVSCGGAAACARRSLLRQLTMEFGRNSGLQLLS